MNFLGFLKARLLFIAMIGTGLSAFSAENLTLPQSGIGQYVSGLSTALLEKVTPAQKEKIKLSFDSKKRNEWRYFPEPSLATKLFFPSRAGVSYLSLNDDAKVLVDQTLAIALSNQGLTTLKSILELEKNKSIEFRGLLNSILFKYGPENYFVTIFGTPGVGHWAWRFEGHHISVNLTFVDSKLVSTSPLFLGTTLASVAVGNETIQVMPQLIVELNTFAKSLSDDQKVTATQSLKNVPKFNPVAPQLFGGGVNTKVLAEKGLQASQLSRPQIESLKLILTEFAKELNTSTRDHLTELLDEENISTAEVLWAGDFEMKEPFYVRLKSAKFVFELNTSEGHADHYHAAWISL